MAFGGFPVGIDRVFICLQSFYDFLIILHLLALYSREDKHPLTVKFTNKTGKKVQLFWINKKGRRKRKGKIKEGHSKSIDTYETHVFMAVNRKLSREPLLINGTPVFYAYAHKQGDKHVEVEIKKPTGIICIFTILSQLVLFYDWIIKQSCII